MPTIAELNDMCLQILAERCKSLWVTPFLFDTGIHDVLYTDGICDDLPKQTVRVRSP